MKPTGTRRLEICRLRAEALLAVAQGPEFARRLDLEMGGGSGQWVRTSQEVQRLALKILDQMQVDRRGCDLVVTFDPGTRRVDMWVRPVVSVVAEKATLRAVGPGGRL